MVIDTLENGAKYASLHPRLAQAFEYLKSQDLNALEPGKYEIDGKNLHVAVSAKEGVKTEDAKFEAHNSYIDIQVVLSGKETMGWTPRAKCTRPQGEFNTEKDVIFYDDQPQMYFQLTDGEFVIYYPDDVHAPMIGEGLIKKLVVKVKI